MSRPDGGPKEGAIELNLIHDPAGRKVKVGENIGLAVTILGVRPNATYSGYSIAVSEDFNDRRVSQAVQQGATTREQKMASNIDQALEHRPGTDTGVGVHTQDRIARVSFPNDNFKREGKFRIKIRIRQQDITTETFSMQDYTLPWMQLSEVIEVVPN